MKKFAEPIVNGRKLIIPINTKLLMYASFVSTSMLSANSFLVCNFFTRFGFFYQMKDIATENFHRICEAYEILSDPNKRQIYDIYGMEGLNSGLELGAKLDGAEGIKAELERLKKLKEMEKMAAHFRSSGTILANMSLPHCLNGDGLFRGYCSIHHSFHFFCINMNMHEQLYSLQFNL